MYVKKIRTFKCTLLDFMAKAARIRPRSVGTMLPVIPKFVMDGVSSGEVSLLKTILAALPILMESALIHLCREPEVRALENGDDKELALKEMSLINQVTFPLLIKIASNLINNKISEIRMKAFHYFRQCILLLTRPEKEAETVESFCIEKLQPGCTLLKMSKLEDT
eukprot:UN12456